MAFFLSPSICLTNAYTSPLVPGSQGLNILYRLKVTLFALRRTSLMLSSKDTTSDRGGILIWPKRGRAAHMIEYGFQRVLPSAGYRFHQFLS